jgi:DNA ligase-1
MKIREDKGLEDASRPEMLADMYERQEGGKMGETGGIDDGELIDVDFEDEQDEEEDEQSGQE